MTRKRIAILGAGMSGLTSIKACLEEGLEPVCFEGSDDLGGLWRYRPEDVDFMSSVAKSTVINTSKEPSAFSDFPPPKDFPNYMHNRFMFKYFNLYVEHFELRKYIKFYHKVTWVTFAEDYEITGRWSVTVDKLDPNSGASESITDIFDGVMVSSGHHVIPAMPSYEGLDQFKGTVTHTRSYKVPAGYEDKKIMVIGNGNSGVDAAVELSSVGERVYLSTRRGFWLRYRLAPGGYPGDLLVHTRAQQLGIIPYKWNNHFQEKSAMKILDYERYGLKPSHNILAQHPTVGDALANRIINGTVVVKGPIRKFVPNGVLLEREENVVEIDAVVMATGYSVGFPFLDKSIAKLSDAECQLYFFVFPPTLKHPTLAFIGNVQPIGPMFLISELQARWYAQVFGGKVKLPSKDAMMRDIKRRLAINSQFMISGVRHVTEVWVIPYCDLIASQIGAKPNLTKMFFTDYQLFKACFFKAHLAYQYRLRGPHAWDGARNAILTFEERVESAFDTNANLTKNRLRQAKGNITKSVGTLALLFLSAAVAYYALL